VRGLQVGRASRDAVAVKKHLDTGFSPLPEKLLRLIFKEHVDDYRARD
jgi:hypothetical protein